MKISLLNHNFVNSNFKQTNTSTIDMGRITGVNNRVDVFVKSKLAAKKQNKIRNLSTIIYDKFTNAYNQKIKDIEKFQHAYNQALMLQKLALSYRNSGDVERAGIILAQSFNVLDKEDPYRQEKIKKLIESSINKNIFEDFFYCSNNIKAKYFVMKSLNNLNNPYYLSIAEAVCDCDNKRVSLNDKKTIYEAKIFLNKHYNLEQMAFYINENDNYKIAILNLLSKWGLENQQKIAQKLIDDENDFIAAKAQNTISALKNNTNFYNIDEALEENRLLPTNSSKPDKISLLKLIETNPNVDLDCIKQLGNLGTTTREAQAVRPNVGQLYSKREIIKAEAFLKIMIRGNLQKLYLNWKKELYENHTH